MAIEVIPRSPPRERSAERTGARAWPGLVAVIALVPLLLSLPFAAEPMEQDEGVYFTVARHGWPYGDVFDHKPPLIYGWYKLALLISAGQPSIEGVRVLAALGFSIAALAVTWTGITLVDRRTGVIAGLLTGLAATNQYLQPNANSEVFMLVPLTLSLAAFVRAWRVQSLPWYAVAGALAAAAAMTKSVALLHLLVLAGLPCWAAAVGLQQWRAALRASFVVASAGALTITAIAAPFVLAGRGGEFWYANVTYNIAYGAQLGFEDKLFALGEVDRRVIVAGLYLWVPAAAGLALLWRNGATMASAVVVSGAMAAFAGASMTGREYPHYLVPIVPFAALAAAHAYDRMAASWHSTRARLHSEALMLALVVPAIFAVVPLYVLDIEDVHLRKYNNGPNAQRAIANEAIAQRLRELPVEERTLFVLGDDAQLYPLSGFTPVTYHIRPVSDRAVDAGTWARTIEELRAAPPAVIIDAARIEAGVALLSRTPHTVTLDIAPADRAAFDAFLAKGYERVDDLAYASIWIRR